MGTMMLLSGNLVESLKTRFYANFINGKGYLLFGMDWAQH